MYFIYKSVVSKNSKTHRTFSWEIGEGISKGGKRQGGRRTPQPSNKGQRAQAVTRARGGGLLPKLCRDRGLNVVDREGWQQYRFLNTTKMGPK